MDISVQWGVIRHLRSKIQAKSWVPVLAIVLDLAILIPFTVLKLQNDLLTVIVAAWVAASIIIGQTIAARRRMHGE